MNVQGESPLHVLAKKPSVFKSSSHMGLYDSFIYHCMQNFELLLNKSNNQKLYHAHLTKWNMLKQVIFYQGIFIDELKKQEYNSVANKKMSSDTNDKRNYPDNYQTCVNIFHFLWNPIYKSWPGVN